MLYCSFSYGYAAPRDLHGLTHSFPPRRSSDLINMGCPAKKVCNVWAGSALMRDEALVARILSAVVCAVSVPVTLKIRTGWDAHHHNALAIAHIAEDCGIAALDRKSTRLNSSH